MRLQLRRQKGGSVCRCGLQALSEERTTEKLQTSETRLLVFRMWVESTPSWE